MYKFSIVIPCYNEERNISPLVEEFSKINLCGNVLELILVQNGSSDMTKQKIEEAMHAFDWIKMVDVPVNQGYGYGIKQGLKIASGDFLGWMHADLQFSPKEITAAIKLQMESGLTQNVMMKSIRRNRPLSDRFFTFGMSCFESLLLRCKLYDINAQPSIFSRDIYDSWKDQAPDDFSIDLFAYYFAMKNHCRLFRWPAKQSERLYGSSTWNNGFSARKKLIRRTISYSLSMRRNLMG